MVWQKVALILLPVNAYPLTLELVLGVCHPKTVLWEANMD